MILACCNAKPAEGALTWVLTVIQSLYFFCTHFLFDCYLTRDHSLLIATYCQFTCLTERYFLLILLVHCVWFCLVICFSIFCIIPFVLVAWSDWCFCLDLLPAYSLLPFGIPLCMLKDLTATLVLTLCLPYRICGVFWAKTAHTHCGDIRDLFYILWKGIIVLFMLTCFGIYSTQKKKKKTPWHMVLLLVHIAYGISVNS